MRLDLACGLVTRKSFGTEFEVEERGNDCADG